MKLFYSSVHPLVHKIYFLLCMHPYHFRNHHLHQEVAGNVFQKYSIYNVILLYFLNTLYYIIFLNVKCTYMFDKQYIFSQNFSVGREIFLSPTLNIIQPFLYSIASHFEQLLRLFFLKSLPNFVPVANFNRL